MKPKSLEAAEVLGVWSWEDSQACSGESEGSTLKPESSEPAEVLGVWSWEVSHSFLPGDSEVSTLKPKSLEAAAVLGDWSWEVSQDPPQHTHTLTHKRIRTTGEGRAGLVHHVFGSMPQGRLGQGG